MADENNQSVDEKSIKFLKRIEIIFCVILVAGVIVIRPYIMDALNEIKEENNRFLEKRVIEKKVTEELEMKTQKLAKIGSNYTYTFYDVETGVWYIATNNGGITPRLNVDGTLYVSEVEKASVQCLTDYTEQYKKSSEGNLYDD